jgi:hypothetical protein
MHTIFIVFISFVAYATGVVTVRRWGREAPTRAVHWVEMLLAFSVVVSGVFLRRPRYSLRYVALCALGMLLSGAVVGGAMLLRKKQAVAGTREYEEGQGNAEDLSLWKRWLNSSRAVVDYEFRLLLLACYFLIIGPFAIAFRLGRTESAADESLSAWVPRNETSGMDAARRPF